MGYLEKKGRIGRDWGGMTKGKMEKGWLKRPVGMSTLACLSSAGYQDNLPFLLSESFTFLHVISLTILCVSAARYKHQQLEKRVWVAEPAGLGASNWRKGLQVTGAQRSGWQWLDERQ